MTKNYGKLQLQNLDTLSRLRIMKWSVKVLKFFSAIKCRHHSRLLFYQYCSDGSDDVDGGYDGDNDDDVDDGDDVDGGDDDGRACDGK